MRSMRRGRGLEYEESRAYQPGDDVRHLDSRVTARRGELFTKVYREERERPTFICLDDSAPMHFATRGCFKRVTAASIAALFAWHAYHRGERIGWLNWNETATRSLPPRHGRNHILRFMGELTAPSRRDAMTGPVTTSATSVMQQVKRDQPPGTRIIIISDFRGLSLRDVQQVSQGRSDHRILVVRVTDPLERALPEYPARFVVSNTFGSAVLFGNDRRGRQRFLENYSERTRILDRWRRALNAPLVNVSTDDDPALVVREFLLRGE